MKQGLQLRLSQHLALTPQLQQAIRLLQLSTLELNQEIEQALQDNPLLEREDTADPAIFAPAGDAMVATPQPAGDEAPLGADGHDHDRGDPLLPRFGQVATAFPVTPKTTSTPAISRRRRPGCASISMPSWP